MVLWSARFQLCPIELFTYHFRIYIIKWSVGKVIKEELHYLTFVIEHCNIGDWFILMQLSKHIHPGIFREFIIDLKKELTLKNRPSLLSGVEESKY